MKKRNAASIGIIGAANGPTAVFARRNKNTEKTRQEREAFFSRAQQMAQPCEKSLDEVIAHLTETYHARKIELTDGEKTSIKINILLNHYPDLIHREPMPENPTPEQICAWHERDTSFGEARAYPIEKLDLEMEGYEIPEEEAEKLRKIEENEQNADLSQTAFARMIDRWATWWRGTESRPAAKPQPLTVSLERKHNYMVIRGKGGSVLSDEMAVFGGISGQDIAEKTPRFLVYADLMRKRGIWK